MERRRVLKDFDNRLSFIKRGKKVLQSTVQKNKLTKLDSFHRTFS